MKRILSVLAVLVLLVCLTPARDASAMGTVQRYVATYDYFGLKLRPEPNTTKTEYCKIPHRTLLTLYNLSDDGLWASTYYNGHEGWVMMKYLTTYDPGPVPSGAPGRTTPKPSVTTAPTAAPADTTLNDINTEYKAMMRNVQPQEMTVMCIRRGTKCNLRWAPSTRSTAIRTDVVYGDTFTVLSIGNKWYQVYDEVSDRIGFLLISLTGVVTGN